MTRRFSETGRAAIRAREERKRERWLAEGFWSKVDRSGGSNACWPWTGALQTDRFGAQAGYGYFTRDCGRVVYVHRHVLELSLGRPIGPRKVAMHSCDNPPCCNPAHLSEATQAENMADMSRKGRHVGTRQLTPNDVRVIRLRLASGEPQRAIGESFGLTRSAIAQIAQGRTWIGVGL